MKLMILYEEKTEVFEIVRTHHQMKCEMLHRWRQDRKEFAFSLVEAMNP